jgi:hypothetical protein
VTYRQDKVQGLPGSKDCLGSCIEIKYQLKRKANPWISACAGMTAGCFLFTDPLVLLSDAFTSLNLQILGYVAVVS